MFRVKAPGESLVSIQEISEKSRQFLGWRLWRVPCRPSWNLQKFKRVPRKKPQESAWSVSMKSHRIQENALSKAPKECLVAPWNLQSPGEHPGKAHGESPWSISTRSQKSNRTPARSPPRVQHHLKSLKHSRNHLGLGLKRVPSRSPWNLQISSECSGWDPGRVPSQSPWNLEDPEECTG